MIVIEGKRRPVESLAFHPDGKRLAVGGGENTWTLFRDATTGSEVGRWPANPHRIPHNIAFHPSGRSLFAACGDKGLYTIDVGSGFIGVQKETAYDLAVAPDGERLVVRGAGDRILSYLASPKRAAPEREWLLGTGNAEGWMPQAVAFFPDGERVASAEYRDATTGPADARLVMRSAADGSLVGELGTARGTPWEAEVSPDGEWVALRVGGDLLLFAASGPGEPVTLVGPNKKHPTAVAFHPDGRYLAVTCNDRTVRFHDRDANWAITRTLEWDAGRLRSVAFNAEGTLAAAGGDTGKVVVWDVDA